jgi:glycosyltransferase involved in cell wall biosynthesis
VACPDPSVEEDVRREAAALSIGDRVLAIGYRRDMPDVLAAADVVADLSWGGLGITGTIREAMAMGKPVIASAAGGNPELVQDGVSGLLVPPRDPPAFAVALERLLRDPELAARLGRGGRARVEAGFTVEKRLDRIEALYARLISERERTAESGEARSGGTSREERRK